MKKRYIIIFVVLLAVLGGVPYLFGSLLEHKFNETVALMNKVDNVSVTVQEYKRGWLRSTAKTEVKTRFEAKEEPFVIVFEHDIAHGPFFQERGNEGKSWQFAEGEVYSKAVDLDKRFVALTNIKDQSFFNFTMLVTIDGRIEIALKGEKFELKDGEQQAFDWQGMNGHFTLSNQMNHISGETVMPGIGFTAPDGAFQLKDLVVKIDRFLGTAPFNDIWLGTGSFNAHRLSGQSTAKQTSFDLSEVALGGVIEPDDSWLKLSGTMSANQIETKDKKYGPLNYSAQLKKISPDGIRLIEKLNQQAKANPTMGNLVFIEKMGDIAKTFLTPRPEANIQSFQLNTPDGQLTGNLHVEIGGENANNIQMPQAILDSILGQAEFICPKPVFKQIIMWHFSPVGVSLDPTQAAAMDAKIDPMIDSLVQNGMLVVDGDHYKLNFEFKGAQVTLNGKPFGLQNMMAGVSGTPTPGAANAVAPATLPAATPMPVLPATPAPTAPDAAPAPTTPDTPQAPPTEPTSPVAAPQP